MTNELYYAAGMYWWKCLEHGDEIILRPLRDDGTGKAFPSASCRKVTGREYDRQIEAIRYFLEPLNTRSI